MGICSQHGGGPAILRRRRKLQRGHRSRRSSRDHGVPLFSKTSSLSLSSRVLLLTMVAAMATTASSSSVGMETGGLVFVLVRDDVSASHLRCHRFHDDANGNKEDRCHNQGQRERQTEEEC